MDTQTEMKKPWAGLGYEPVPALVNRKVSRWLRAQRKNIRRALAERGFFDLLQEMEELKRDSRRTAMQKNRIFQRIMNAYIARVTPASAVVGTPAHPDIAGDDRGADLAVPAEAAAVDTSDGGVGGGSGTDAGDSVLAVAPEAREDGSLVIAE